MAETGLKTTLARASTFLPNLMAGLVLGFTEVIFAISLASLMFSGPLTAYLPRGMAITLVTVAAHVLFTALFSSAGGVISSVQDNSTVLLAVAVTAMSTTITSSDELAAAAVALILVTTLLTGAFLVLIGSFGLGGLVRYIPYPVIGGFLAGTGWLLVQGAVGTMADFPLTLDTLPALIQPDQVMRWLPGVIFGLALLVGVRRIHHSFAMPGILLGGLIVFFALLIISGISIEQAAERGLLLGNVGSQISWQPLPLPDLAQANWAAIIGQAGNIGAIIILTTISLLLNVSGLELTLRQNMDLNHELRTAGFANLLSGLAGGMIGFHTLSFSALTYRLGARGRTTAIVIGAICLITLIVGAAVLAYMPRPLIGGLLLFMGLDFMVEWLVVGYKKLNHLDYGVVVLILLFIAASGFLVGVGVGLVLMVVIFVVNYSRTNIFHHILTGAEVTSKMERTLNHQRALAKAGRSIYVLELQGFIFFGTANALFEQVYKRLNDDMPLLFVILDFRRVTGVDSSAAFSFAKIKNLAETRQFALVITDLPNAVQRELVRDAVFTDDHMTICPDLDHGLEWCENRLLDMNQITKTHVPATLHLQLAENGWSKDDAKQIKTYLEKLRFAPGDYVIQQGAAATDLYFIELGQVSVYLELDNHRRVRLRTLGMGTIVGELGFYVDMKRSASVIADMDTFAYRLTRDGLQAMKTNAPELAITFNEFMLRVISERLVMNNQELMALNR